MFAVIIIIDNFKASYNGNVEVLNPRLHDFLLFILFNSHEIRDIFNASTNPLI